MIRILILAACLSLAACAPIPLGNCPPGRPICVN
jgi:starvation-inducible outer membrane lipoprotein